MILHIIYGSMLMLLFNDYYFVDFFLTYKMFHLGHQLL